MSDAKPKEDLQIYEDHFLHCGTRYSLEDIEHIAFIATHTTVRRDFVKTGDRDTSVLELHMRNKRKPLVITAGYVWFFTIRDTKGMTQSLREMYAHISEATYSNRVKPYMAAVETQGYFTYDGTRFYANGDVIQKQKRINVADAILYRNPQNGFQIIISERNQGSLKSWFRTVVPFMKIYVVTDQDVFHSLLYTMYGITMQ